VNDEKIVTDMNREVFQELGYTVVTETDPVRAAALFKEKRDRFDPVVTDNTMLRMTGFDLTRAIKDIRADRPVVISSGFQEKGDMEKLAEYGIRRMIVESAAMNVMAQTIRDVPDNKP
jgi:two-component system cell cycle sensor histidine kinase/response regulator CckA